MHTFAPGKNKSIIIKKLKMIIERKKAEVGTLRFRRIRNCIFISGLSVFAQLYLCQPMLSELCSAFKVTPAMSSLSVSMSTIGMAIGLLIFAFKADSMLRKHVMVFSLIASAVLTILSAFSWSFPVLLVINFLKGIVLSGVSAVALAYLSEEVSASVIGLAISLYLSGNTIGGMSGRVAGTLLSGWSDWRHAAAIIGVICLVLGIIFILRMPHSKNFSPSHVSMREKLTHMGQFLRKFSFLSMYLIAALAMGAFVSVYNYLSFILKSPVFGLPHYIIAFIFMMYTLGVVGSVTIGKLSDKYNPIVLLQLSLLLMAADMLFLLIMQLWAIIIGLGVMTFAFFSAHTMASRIVSINAHRSKSTATSVYWLFYYAGSSIAGSLTGIVLSKYGWSSFVWLVTSLVIVSLLISVVSVEETVLRKRVLLTPIRHMVRAGSMFKTNIIHHK